MSSEITRGLSKGEKSLAEGSPLVTVRAHQLKLRKMLALLEPAYNIRTSILA